MELEEQAKKNHDKFLKNDEYVYGDTDPEFVEIFSNFLFGEVIENCKLPDKTRMLIVLASLVTNSAMSEYKLMLEGALNLKVTPIEIKEMLYQCVPYVGIGKVFDFIGETNQIFEDRGIKLPLEGQATITRENRKQKGYEKQTKFFGVETIDNMRKNAPKGQEHFQDFLQGYCFGDFYTREGLDDKDRELITFSIIATLGGCENQLRGHVNGNLNVGNDKETLVNATTAIMPFIGFPRTLNTLSIINEICK